METNNKEIILTKEDIELFKSILNDINVDNKNHFYTLKIHLKDKYYK